MADGGWMDGAFFEASLAGAAAAQRDDRDIWRAIQPILHIDGAYSATDENRGVVAAPGTGNHGKFFRRNRADYRKHDLPPVGVAG